MKEKATYKVLEFSSKTAKMVCVKRGLSEKEARKCAADLNEAENVKEEIESTFAPLKEIAGKHLPINHV